MTEFGWMERRISESFVTSLLWMFLRLASCDGLTVVINCTAGKGRTEALAALILLILDVFREDAFTDHIFTENFTEFSTLDARIPDLLARMSRAEPSPGLVSELAAARTSYLDAVLSAIGDEYGPLEVCLTATGIDSEMIETRGSRLLEG